MTISLKTKQRENRFLSAFGESEERTIGHIERKEIPLRLRRVGMTVCLVLGGEIECDGCAVALYLPLFNKNKVVIPNEVRNLIASLHILQPKPFGANSVFSI